MKKNNNQLIYKKRLKPREVRTLWLSRIFLWISICIIMFPVIWVVGASLSPGDAFFSGDLFPSSLSLSNYKEIFTSTDLNFLNSAKNSAILCFSVAVLQVFLTATSAYAFSRMKFKGRKYGLMSLLILQMFPAMMAIPAIMATLYKYELIDKLWPLIILFAAGSAFNVWLLKGFMDGIPRELDEAAKVDGASHFQIFSRIILPLAKPMIAVMFFFSIVGTYNEFIISSIALKSPDTYTIIVTLQSFISGKFDKHWPQFAAGSLIASLPLMILFMVMQKFIEKGLTAGAVKG